MQRIALFASAVLFLTGCESTPRQPVMRPIPPPPPGPPPGAAVIIYGPATNVVMVPATNVVAAPSPVPQGNYEVTSNYVAGARTATNATTATAVQGGPNGQAPQYEIVPPRPGPDYYWREGFWSWQGTWVWVPGQWMYQPPAVIFVPEPGFSYHYHFGGPYRYGYRRHPRWR